MLLLIVATLALLAAGAGQVQNRYLRRRVGSLEIARAKSLRAERELAERDLNTVLDTLIDSRAAEKIVRGLLPAAPVLRRQRFTVLPGGAD